MLLLTMSPNAVYGRPRAGLIDDEGNYTMDMTGKTVMITGASRGIGAEAARVFADAGANVVLMARSQDAIADLAGEIGKQAIAILQEASLRKPFCNASRGCFLRK